MMRKSFCFYILRIVLILLISGRFIYLPNSLLAQQNAIPADEAEQLGEFEDGAAGAEGVAGSSVGSSDSFFRFSVLTEMMALRFNDPHPYKQMTGSKKFDDPSAPPQFLGDSSFRINNQEDHGELQPILRPLPAFSVEYVLPLDFFVINGASFMYYHTSTALFDAVVAFQASGAKSTIPLIKMRIYYDLFSASVHFLNPAEEGVDIFAGLGVGSIDGAYEGGFRGRIENDFVRTVETVNFSALPVPFRKVGLDVNGETFGLRFAVYTFSRAEVITKNVFVGNPLTPNANKRINFDGLILRAALTWRL
ncbi:MAG: hypothetical protein HQM14_00815 [SAR324 cluster bacterium]|nr:hypothetical protein [SAR324 cluster bacterium]